ncbi:polysaccharide deacetylase family protein [Lutimonas saemankumensis]|uniref:polysaccharide deacetylase family protein n=1 Tax=Lutimonas saemankumensis TaxID=483016 RepID=UPI001CD5EB18|nr:polysaccharide deacetylase family protein [Lutimonas saemankumensis]MCA0933306.1 polysaccharide deacetylase family protein [Lutimonas saemankumensis]
MHKTNTFFSVVISKKYKRLIFPLFFFIVSVSSVAQENIATKLGYEADARLLIIHADDLGVAHSENRASIKAIEEGSVNSASVMMPTPWVLEAANYAKENAETHDFGLHLVLSSEWKNYKWGPVTSRDKVPSLIDDHGYFHNECKSDMNIEEVETELRSQIHRAYAMGLIPTHLDTHMGCLVQTQELMEVYLKMGKEYKLPVLASKMFPADLLEKYDVRIVLEEILTIMPEQYEKGTVEYYTEAIKNLKPGLSTFLIHTAYDDAELKGMTIEHPDWGNAWRQKDYDFFTSESCKDLLKKEDIKLVTWRQLKDAYFTNR